MAHQHQNIQYGPFALSVHNPVEVARLIYTSAPALFSVMFGPWAIKILSQLVQRPGNRFSPQHIRVATLNQQVVGIVIMLPSTCAHEPANDYTTVLNPVHRGWLMVLQALLLRHLLQEEHPVGSLYISNLAVSELYRNQGIGRQLLADCIAAATAQATSIFISVDVSNKRAQKLYESLGFKVVDTNIIHCCGRVLGSHFLGIKYG